MQWVVCSQDKADKRSRSSSYSTCKTVLHCACAVLPTGLQWVADARCIPVPGRVGDMAPEMRTTLDSPVKRKFVNHCTIGPALCVLKLGKSFVFGSEDRKGVETKCSR